MINFTDNLNLKDGYYIEKLTVLKVYILICLDSMQKDLDIFSIKLKEYKKEYARLETEAIAKNKATSNLNIEIVRG